MFDTIGKYLEGMYICCLLMIRTYTCLVVDAYN